MYYIGVEVCPWRSTAPASCWPVGPYPQPPTNLLSFRPSFPTPRLPTPPSPTSVTKCVKQQCLSQTKASLRVRTLGRVWHQARVSHKVSRIVYLDTHTRCAYIYYMYVHVYTCIDMYIISIVSSVCCDITKHI